MVDPTMPGESNLTLARMDRRRTTSSLPRGPSSLPQLQVEGVMDTVAQIVDQFRMLSCNGRLEKVSTGREIDVEAKKRAHLATSDGLIESHRLEARLGFGGEAVLPRHSNKFFFSSPQCCRGATEKGFASRTSNSRIPNDCGRRLKKK